MIFTRNCGNTNNHKSYCETNERKLIRCNAFFWREVILAILSAFLLRRGFAWSTEPKKIPEIVAYSSLQIGVWIVLAGLKWIVALEGVGGYVRIEKGRISPSYPLVFSSLSRYPHHSYPVYLVKWSGVYSPRCRGQSGLRSLSTATICLPTRKPKTTILFRRYMNTMKG